MHVAPKGPFGGYRLRASESTVTPDDAEASPQAFSGTFDHTSGLLVWLWIAMLPACQHTTRSHGTAWIFLSQHFKTGSSGVKHAVQVEHVDIAWCAIESVC